MVVFNHPFLLEGMTSPHPAGHFELRSYDEDLDVMWQASRTRLSLILTAPGRSEAWPITNDELERVLAEDGQHDSNTGHS